MGSDAQWVQAMQAKYFPRGAFWSIQRRNRCSKLWKQIMGLRPLLENHIAWKIGYGENIPIFSQPWLPGWSDLSATTAHQRRERVASLLVAQSRNWNFDALQQLLGYSRALQIATLDSTRPSPYPSEDKLIFTYSKNGAFSVRKAYQLMKGMELQGADKEFWKWVWKSIPITPKLQVFIWRCARSAIPVMAVLAARIRHLSPLCPICKTHPETIMHALFH